MPQLPLPERLPIDIPLLGIDRAAAYTRRPAGTSPDGRNVRSVDGRDRKALGKRDGYTRAFTTRAGTTASRRGIGLAPMSLATGVISTAAATVETVVEAFADYTASATPNLLGNYVWYNRAPASASNGASTTDAAIVAAPLRLQLRGFGTERSWLNINYHTTNDILARFRAISSATAAVNNIATGCCLKVRCSDDGTDWIQARLETNGANMVRIRVEKQVGATLSLIGFSSNIGLVTATAGESDDLDIRLVATATTITVSVAWPTKTGDDPLWAGFNYSVDNTDLSANQRAGVGCAPGASATVSTTVLRITYTRRIPADATVVRTILGTSTESPLTDQYIMPTGWDGFNTTSAGVVTSVTGPTSSASAIGTRLWPGVDQTNSLLDGGDAAAAGGPTKMILPTAAVPVGQRYGVEWMYPDNDNSGNDVTPAGRILNAFTGCLKLRCTREATYAAATRITTFFTAGKLVPTMVVAGALTSLGATEKCNIPIHTRSWIRFEDDGTTLKISQNGMTVYSFAYSALAAWTAGGAGSGATVLANATKVGLGPQTATSNGAFGFRVIRLDTTASTSVGEFTNRVLVLTNGLAQHGRLDDEDSLTTMAGTGLFNSIPSVFDFNQKWYGVDGGVSKIMDPGSNTSEDWTATDGVFPGGARLACLYRGCAILARFPDNPSLYIGSRVFDPLDFDINADPVATSAFAGSDPDIGQPGDAITALIPFNDDLLFFGCATSIYVLEGHPGYGGQCNNVSTTAGVVGPRAWCFDDKGNLYFLGPKGLYRIPNGTRDIGDPIDGGRVPAYLDRVNLDTTFVQLTFDKLNSNIHIWLTPTDGVTVGLHVVMNVTSKEIWLDELPLAVQPFAVCNITGVEDRDRRFLIMGDDGYVRRPDDDAFGDDADPTDVAYPIDSWVEIGPFQINRGDVNALTTEINCFLASNTTGSLSWYWFVDNSPEEVAAQTWGQEVASGTWGGANGTGFQPPTGLRQCGGAHKLRLRQTSATTDWAIEEIWAMWQKRSRRR